MHRSEPCKSSQNRIQLDNATRNVRHLRNEIREARRLAETELETDKQHGSGKTAARAHPDLAFIGSDLRLILTERHICILSLKVTLSFASKIAGLEPSIHRSPTWTRLGPSCDTQLRTDPQAVLFSLSKQRFSGVVNGLSIRNKALFLFVSMDFGAVTEGLTISSMAHHQIMRPIIDRALIDDGWASLSVGVVIEPLIYKCLENEVWHSISERSYPV